MVPLIYLDILLWLVLFGLTSEFSLTPPSRLNCSLALSIISLGSLHNAGGRTASS